MRSTQRFFDMQKAFTGSSVQTGPPVNPSKRLLGMKFAGKHGQTKVLDLSSGSLWPGCPVQFLDSQINGAVFMLQRSCGTIPIDKDRSMDTKLHEIATSLRSVQTYGGFLVDTMGFGKTFTALLFLSYYVKCTSQALIPSQTGFRPTLCIVPSGVLLHQWTQAIEKFPELTLIIAHGEKPPSGNANWVSATNMRQAPKDLKTWPPFLHYIFDQGCSS